MPAAQPVSVPVVPLAQIVRRMGLHHLDITGAHVKADGLPQGPFELVDGTASTMAYPCLWNHDDTRERRLRVDPDSHCRIRQVRGRIPATLTERAELRWATATRAHYGCDLRFNSQSIIVAMTEQLTLRGRAWPWPSVVFDDPQHEVVFALWANSTLGLVCHWWMSNKSQIGRGTTTVTSIPAMAVLDVRQLSDDRLMKAAAQFETVKDRRFLPFDQLDEDEARADLDRRLLVSVLGLPGGLCEPNGAMERLRRKLSIEPRQPQYACTLASRLAKVRQQSCVGTRQATSAKTQVRTGSYELAIGDSDVTPPIRDGCSPPEMGARAHLWRKAKKYCAVECAYPFMQELQRSLRKARDAGYSCIAGHPASGQPLL